VSGAALVALALALMPGATGDQPTVSSLRVDVDGFAVGAVTATRPAAPATPRPLRGFGPFTCTRTERSLRCALDAVRRGHVIRVDYVAFTATTTTRTHAAARRTPGGRRL
jgi:hypothetical protein